MALGSDAPESPDRRVWWLALLVLASVVAVWVAAARLVPLIVGKPDEATYAALEALFSGLAFAGVVLTVFLQSRELALQRAELIATREEMARARAESARTASAQETGARLAALVALIEHEKDRMQRLKEEAFEPSVNNLGQIQYVTKDARAGAEYKDASAARLRYLDDLKATYTRIATPTPD